ncbi:MAG: C39 family peptidase [Anaerolineaceae bacterium]
MSGAGKRVAWPALLAVAVVAAGIAVSAGQSLADGPTARPYRAVVPMLAMDPAAPAPTQAPTPAPTSVPPPSVPAGAGANQFVLNEVMFSPASGGTQFVELRNAGGVNASAAGLVLKTSGGKSYTLAGGSAAPGGVVLVRFDGQNGIDGTTVHASPTGFLALAGWVELDLDGGQLDSVAWGEGQPGAVNVGGGGRIPSHIEGLSIGRPPGAVNRRAEGWASYKPAQVTPGLPNPGPLVSGMMPLDGAILQAGPVALAWYSVPGASSYRMQIATDAAFSLGVVERTAAGSATGGVDLVSTTIDGLTAGKYFWRVQAISPDGTAAQFSSIAALTVSSAVSASAAGTVKLLPVPLIKQHKDTSMLWLEGPDETGPKPWDGTWPQPSAPYCARASIAMVNAFYGGQLSQDRISYDMFKDIRPGPEEDLWLSAGLGDNEIERGLRFALGGEAGVFLPGSHSEWVEALMAEIDKGRPVLATTEMHAFVVVGYGRNEDGSWAYLTINDPSLGQYRYGPGGFNLAGGLIDTYFLMPAAPHAVSDEPELKKDSDGDGINDFDEIKRFHTNPNDKDSDHDGVNDKQEVRASVFDPKHGYSTGAEHDGRDFDHDHLAMELDPDSDNGGCLDGQEDLNGDGRFDASSEIYNFDQNDDGCASGTYHSHLEVVRHNSDSVSFIADDLAATFAFTVAKDGQLTGTASVTYWFEGRTEGSSSCPLIEQPRVTVSWAGQVSGAITDGYILVTSGCGITLTDEKETVRFAGYGSLKLTDGHYDEHIDYPLVFDATVWYSDLHIANKSK